MIRRECFDGVMCVDCVLLAHEWRGNGEPEAFRDRNRVAFASRHYKANPLDCSVARGSSLLEDTKSNHAWTSRMHAVVRCPPGEKKRLRGADPNGPRRVPVVASRTYAGLGSKTHRYQTLPSSLAVHPGPATHALLTVELRHTAGAFRSKPVIWPSFSLYSMSNRT